MNNEVRFLIQCYFGFEEDPILSAIDRAYRDMAAHTLSDDAQSVLYPLRKEITEYLHDELQQLPDKNIDFDKWHEDTSQKMKEKYNKLTYGQIQKWLNMSIKYIYTLKKLGVSGINDYYVDEEHVNSFHAPLDSYVLKAIKKKRPVWSKIDSYEAYKERQKMINFITEYSEWSKYAKDAMMDSKGNPKKADKNTYRRYLQDNGGYTFKEQEE